MLILSTFTTRDECSPASVNPVIHVNNREERDGLTRFQYTVGDVQEFSHHRADDEHGGLACVGQAGSKGAAPGGVGDIGGAQGRDFLEEPPD